jgi:prevent-host-death family protein
MCYIVHMQTVSIRELHLGTGSWVRRVARDGRVVVTDRGRPVATLSPLGPEDLGTAFGNRKLARGFKPLTMTTGDSTGYVSEDRDRT